MNPILNPATIKTILNNAPMLIQGASKLIKIIRERDVDKPNTEQEIPVTLEGLKLEIIRLEQQLDANADSDVEQIKLIEQLAKQNEALADSLNKTYDRLNLLTFLALSAFMLASISIFISLSS